MIKLNTQSASILAIATYWTATTAHEFQYIPAQEQENFLLLKGGAIGLTLLCFFWATLFPKSRWVNYATPIVWLAYCLIGSLYQPFYIITLLEAVLLYFFIFPHSPGFFWFYSLGAFVLFEASLTWRWPNIPENTAPIGLADFQGIAARFSAILIFIYLCFYRARVQREEAEARFLLIGRQTARIAHDVKNMLTGARQHLSFLSADQEEETAFPVLENISARLQNIQKTIADLSFIASGSQRPASEFTLSDCIASTSAMFGRGMKQVKLEIRGDMRLVSDRSLLASICFHLMANSLTAFAIKPVDEPIICWEINETLRKITYSDNSAYSLRKAVSAAPTFPREESHTDLATGWLIVRDCAKNLNASISFEGEGQENKVAIYMPPGLA